MSTPNPILPPTALLRPQMPGVYDRPMIYDPTWDDPLYSTYVGQRIVPALSSLVHDTDGTPLWVIAVDPTTYVPTYSTVAVNSNNDNSISILNYGATVFRLYLDNRNLPYPAQPDSKCIFIGKSPRFYTLVRYPNTSQETIISQYFNTAGQHTSDFIPLIALDNTNSSWRLPRCHVSVLMDDHEEIGVKIFGEDGVEMYSTTLFTKQSAVINQEVMYSPTIVGITVSGIQQLANGVFYLFEKQDFDSLGLQATLVYDNGSTATIPVDGDKCILYGADDFISSFAGLRQPVTIKYYRSNDEVIAPGLGDVTGSMISVDIPVTVIPNTLGVTNKIIAIPTYRNSIARYIVQYWLYFADGRGYIDVSAYVTIKSGQLVTDSSYFGLVQSYVIGLDMKQVDPVHYPTSAIYQQTVVLRFNPPNTLVRWTIRDSITSPDVYGQDNSLSRRPSVRYDATRQQYFIPTSVFNNAAAFLTSFYYKATPPYDPSVAELPQTPTHFTVRDILTGAMLTSALIPIASYGTAFNMLGDATGAHVGTVVMVEFVNVINSSTRNVLYGVPVDVITGTYV